MSASNQPDQDTDGQSENTDDSIHELDLDAEVMLIDDLEDPDIPP